MRDGDAFTKFLAEEVRVVTGGAIVNLNVKCYGADTNKYHDGWMPIEDVLYQFVRCTLAHEGRMGENVEFGGNTDQLSIQVTDERIILSGEMLLRLLLVVEYAPENATEFPEIAEMPAEVVGWNLFGQRRSTHTEYIAVRQTRLLASRPPCSP